MNQLKLDLTFDTMVDFAPLLQIDPAAEIVFQFPAGTTTKVFWVQAKVKGSLITTFGGSAKEAFERVIQIHLDAPAPITTHHEHLGLA